jgi:hypothetical protein
MERKYMIKTNMMCRDQDKLQFAKLGKLNNVFLSYCRSLEKFQEMINLGSPEEYGWINKIKLVLSHSICFFKSLVFGLKKKNNHHEVMKTFKSLGESKSKHVPLVFSSVLAGTLDPEIQGEVSNGINKHLSVLLEKLV